MRIELNQLHWYSNFCPYFSVFDAEKFLGETITLESLKRNGHERGFFWLANHQEEWKKHLERASEAATHAVKTGAFQFISWGGPNYPENLAHLAFPPSILFVRGDVASLSEAGVAVVGSRHPTDLGRLWVKEVVPDLVASNLIIVSGGARGIDGEAHFAALRAKGRTIAFLPGGVDKPYPSGNSDILERAAKSGALVSEFLPGTIVKPENFHRRNRLIAGLSSKVVIVEAALKSGTMMTALKAMGENREVLVVPGPPMVASYAGSLELLTQGAGLARNASDIIKSR